MKREFQVGDVCRIREWDDMAAEYGVDGDGDIWNLGVGFLHGMKRLCGRRFTVSEKKIQNYGIRYYSEENVEVEGIRKYIITGDMLEFFEESVPSDPIRAPGDFCSLFN